LKAIFAIFECIIITVKRLSLFLATIIGIACCVKRPDSPELLQIESFLQCEPVRALEELRALDTNELYGAKNKALYSLLLSVALDKNYIDICSDSIIGPAVKYYSRTSDRYHTFLSYYSLGRVWENAEDYDKAISAYIEAAKIPDKYIPLDYQARLHMRKSIVYYHQFALDKALNECKIAKELSSRVDNHAFYVHSCVNLASTLDSMGSYDLAFEELASLREWMTQHSVVPPVNFYTLWIRLMITRHNGDSSTVKKAFNEYKQICKQYGVEISHLLAADYYSFCGEPDKAYAELNNYTLDEAANSFTYVQYYSALAKIEKELGHYKEAFEAQALYDKKLGEMNLQVFNNDVRFLEEKSKTELEKAKAKHRTTVLLFISIFAICALGALIFSLINKQKQFNREIEKAKSEYDFLKSIAAVGEKYPEDLRQAISERLQALRPYIIPGKHFFSAERNSILKETNDKRQEMLGNIGLIYALTFPGFVSKLNGYHLNAQEIGLCCMYLSGYSAKELSGMKNSNLAYQENTIIRQKLGIEPNGVKLSTRLREIFNESVPNSF
jgi:tetratricopeptide (TPR) repeat protein